MANQTAVEKVLDEVEARLRIIASRNGYGVTLRKIERARTTPWQDGDLPACVFWSDGLSASPNEYGLATFTATVSIQIHDKTRDQPFVNLASALARDVVTALHRSPADPSLADGSQSMNLGGLVESLRLERADYLVGQGQAPWYGVTLDFTATWTAAPDDLEGLTP